MRRLALAALVLCFGSEAWAQDKQQCVDAYTRAQLFRAKKKLRDSKKFLEVCAADSCPEALKRDCVPWLGEVEKSLPSLTVEATDEAGRALDDARVTIDGEPALAGRAMELDPGDHALSVGAAHFSDASQQVSLAAGETRTVRVTLRSAPTTPPPEPKRVVPVAPFVFTALAAGGIGVFIGFGLAGNGIKSDLDAEACKPNCPQTRVDAIKGDYVAADVALGVGLAFAVAATIAFIVSPWHEKAPIVATPGGVTLRF